MFSKIYCPVFRVSSLVILILLLGSKLCFGQIGKATVIPPPPAAAALAAVADVPISLYTGTPNIDFPLYNLTCGAVNVGISLSYNARGIRVEDVSTGLGVGWMLNAGGVVTRAIRGRAESWLPNEPSNTVTNSTDPTAADFNSIVEWADLGVGERDIYHYNFNGYSGSFYVINGVAKFRKYEDIKIELNETSYGELYDFVITTPDGTEYGFKPIESNGMGETTAWALDKIRDANGIDYISFEYVYAGGRITAPRNSVYYYFVTYNPTPNIVYNTYADTYTWDDIGHVVSKITSSRSHVVEFKYKRVTMDIQAANRLAMEEMLVYDMYGKKVKTIAFEVKSFETIQPYTNPYPAYPGLHVTTSMNYREYLENFSEIGVNGEKITHSFEYYGRTPDGKDGLPNTLSYAQDMGGLYNGKNNNYGLIPTFNETLNPFLGDIGGNICIDERYPLDPVYIPGSDRSPDVDYMKYGTIKSIKYPTGGKVDFSFTQKINPNGQVPYYGFNVSQIDYVDVSGQVVKSKKYTYEDATLGHNEPPFYSYTWNKIGSNALSITPPCGCGPVGQGCEEYLSWRTTLELSPGPKLDIGLYDGPHLAYGKVTEYETGNGRTEYIYSNESGEQDVLSHEIRYMWAIQHANNGHPGDYNQITHFWGDFWPLGPYPNNSWKRGTLLSKKTYNQSGQYIEGTEFGYSFLEQETINSLKIFTVIHVVSYLLYPYSVKTSWIRLDNKIEYKDGVTKHTNYAYNGNNHRQKTEEWYTGSDGKERKTTYSYPPDLQNPINEELTRRHIIAPVLEKKDYNDGSFVQAEYTNFGAWANGNWGGQPASSMIFPHYSEYAKGSGSPEKLFRNYAFSNEGNLLSVGAENDVRKSYIWGYKNSYPIAEVVNAKETEIFFDGFEESGTWDGVVYDNTRSHTGKYAARIDNPTNSGEITYHSLKWLNVFHATPRKYKYTGWVYSNGPSVELFLFMKNPGETGYFSYVDAIATHVTNQWVYIEKEFTVPATVTQLNLRIDNNGGGTVWYDDIRLHPADAKMTTYTYTPQIGMTSASDINSRPITYEYDIHGRVTLIRDKDRNILKRYCYNYAGQQSTCNFVGNAAKSKVFYKSGCDAASGKYGSAVTYTVPENTFFGVTTEEANALAQAEIDAKGQAYANANGTCLQGEPNDPRSGVFIRSNCGYRGTGGPATYVVDAGKYAAATKGEANQLADTDVAANGPGHANTAGGCTFTSEPQNVPFNKTNCTNGGVGGTVYYPVPDGKYTSTISLQDANTQALNEANLYGPGNANTHGVCWWYSDELYTNFYNQNCTGGSIALPYWVGLQRGYKTSNISQQDANNQAWQYAQQLANTYGECQNTGTQFYYQNTAPDWISVQLVNKADNSLNYFFEIPPSGQGDFFIRVGNYEVTIWPSNQSIYHDYSVACDGFVLGDQSWQYVFESLLINEGCNSMSVSGHY